MTRAEKEIYWRDQFQKQEESGLTKSAFCAQHGIKIEGFYRWRKRLWKTSSGALSDAPKFLKVVTPPRSERVQSKTAPSCALQLGKGIELKLSELPSAEWLSELVQRLSVEKDARDHHVGL